MSHQPWEEPEEEETEAPMAMVRSEPVRIRFEVRTTLDDAEAIGLVSYFGDRQLAMRPVIPERVDAIRESDVWSEPVTLVGIGSYEPGTNFLVLSLYAEFTQRIDWHESEVMTIALGTRYRGPHHQRYSSDLERETRDFFFSLLQGNPRVAIEQLFEAARKESVARQTAQRKSAMRKKMMAKWGHLARQHPPEQDTADGVEGPEANRGGYA
jgi:hypothetical protein